MKGEMLHVHRVNMLPVCCTSTGCGSMFSLGACWDGWRQECVTLCLVWQLTEERGHRDAADRSQPEETRPARMHLMIIDASNHYITFHEECPLRAALMQGQRKYSTWYKEDRKLYFYSSLTPHSPVWTSQRCNVGCKLFPLWESFIWMNCLNS